MASQGNALRWPALDLAGRELPAAISCERGIWGKVHGAPSDFRWIATTPGLTAPQRHLERELPLGPEDAPTRATYWRVLGDTCYAVAVYPSQAHDAAGRSGFLEKQVLEWSRPSDVPPVLGALLLLPSAGRLDAEDWWAQRPEARWFEDDDAIALASVSPLPVSVAAIESAIGEGLQALTRATTQEALAEFYANLLAGNRAVALRGLATPLPPAALAALLLPLPRGIADEISIAGWLPSNRISDSSLQDVRRCWSAVLGGATPVSSDAVTPPNDEHVAEGRAMAQSVFTWRAPSRASSATETVNRDAVQPVQLALWGPSAAGKTALLAKLFLDAKDDQWDVFPTQRSLGFIHDMRSRMKTGNQFPPATTVGNVDGIEYVFRHRTRGVIASLQLEDRAGAESEKLHEDAGGNGKITLRQRLGSADGLVLLFDPMSDQAILESRVSQTLELLHVTSGRAAGRDERPIAVCVSKADLLIERPADFRRALDAPDEFVRERVAPVLMTALDRYCSNYRLFPISAAGVRLRQGLVEPAVFIDEALQPRICPGGTPFNLMAPFSWLLNQLTGVS